MAAVVWVLSLLLLLPCGGAAVVFESRYAGYEQFPTDEISINVTSIFISHGFIRQVEQLPAYPHLTSFALLYNQLQTFPNLRSVCQQLTHLQLAGNQIRVIDKDILECLVSLQHLDLSDNLLTSFPAVSHGPRHSLSTLYLTRNQFSEFPNIAPLGHNLRRLFLASNPIQSLPEEEVHALRSLEVLLMPDLRIRTMPDLCRMPHLTSVFAMANTFQCDLNMTWLKLADLGGRPRVIGDWMRCQGPGVLADRSWTSITLDDLKHADETALQAATPSEIEPNNFICAMPPVSSLTTVPGRDECHVTCLESPGCVVFGFHEGEDGEDSLCAITGGPASHAEPEAELTWYTIY